MGLCGPPYLDTSGATLQFPVGGLTNGTPHTFRIRAVNADGKTVSNAASATPVTGVPAKLTGLKTRWDEDINARILEWDRVPDPSILRYEFTTDEGRTWSHLLSGTHTGSRATLPRDQFLSGYTFRIRAVNAAGPGPASEPAVEEEAETVVTLVPARHVRLEWDSTTKKATLVWEQTEHANIRLWALWFSRHNHSQGAAWDTELPIGTTRYEIPATFNAGAAPIVVWIVGCVRPGCLSQNVPSTGVTPGRRAFKVGVPQTAPTGFSATPGDAQITLAWDDPMDSSITKYQYEVGWSHGLASAPNDIPDGNDADTNPGNETSHTVTTINHVYGLTPGEPPVNGEPYHFRLRAANAFGAGPWTQTIYGVTPLAAGAPAAPSGLVRLFGGLGVRAHALMTWDDPHDPSITLYQQWDGTAWQDIPGTDATTTGLDGSIDRLRAVNANGVGPWAVPSNVPSPAPARPTGLQAAPGNGRVTLTWDDPGKGIYIEFYRYTADGGETWTEIPNSQSTAQGQFTRYTVQGLTNGQAYTFAIQAENGYGISPLPAAVTATPRGAAPAKPTGLSAAPGNAEATLTWDDPRDTSITGYQVKQDAAA